MWKDFFYFTKSEQRGFAFFVLLVTGVSGGVFLYSEWSKPTLLSDNEDHLKVYNEFMASIHTLDSIRYKTSRFRGKEPMIVLAPFDPNIADSTEFVRLGLKPYIAGNILRYRAKGGKFRTPQSFAKIYGITDEQFRTLLPYIRIDEAYQKKSDTIRFAAKEVSKDTLHHQFKYVFGTVVDLNRADTSDLKKIPGIGIGIARMITNYRSRLGGFYKVQQLQELAHVSDTLNKWFSVDKRAIRRMNLNKSSIERLKSHPYMNFYQAKVIVEYRKKKGRLSSLKQLALYDEFTAKDIEKLTPYVCFE